jgi:branched-chain amino acid transport system substrate-binding protein
MALSGGCGPSETRIGAILALSGTGELYGQAAKKGIDLAVEEVNAQGGVRGKPLTILYRDSRSVPSAGLEAAMDLIDNEGVYAIIGDMVSDVTLEVAALCDKRQVILFSPGSSVPKLTQAGMYIYRNYASDALEGAYVAQFASEKLRLLSFVVVTVANSYGQGLKEAFLKYYAGPNREVLKSIAFPDGAPDLALIGSTVEELKPDGVYLVAYASDLARIVGELKRRKASTRIIGTRESRDIILGMGEAAEGVIFPLDEYDAASTEPAAQEFVQRFRKKYDGETPGLWAAQGYDAARILAKAVDEAKGTYGQDVQIRLSDFKGYRGATGVTDLDANGDVSRRPLIFIVQGGALVPYEQYEASQAPPGT